MKTLYALITILFVSNLFAQQYIQNVNISDKPISNMLGWHKLDGNYIAMNITEERISFFSLSYNIDSVDKAYKEAVLVFGQPQKTTETILKTIYLWEFPDREIHFTISKHGIALSIFYY